MKTQQQALKKIKKLRRKVDQIDRKLLATLRERFSVIEHIGALKNRHGLPIMQKNRSNEILKDRKKRGKKLGLDGPFIAALYKLIFKKAIERQKGQKK